MSTASDGVDIALSRGSGAVLRQNYWNQEWRKLRECLFLIVATEEWTMRMPTKSPGEKIVNGIKRATRKHCSSEKKIRIVLDGLRGEDGIADLRRREGILQVT